MIRSHQRRRIVLNTQYFADERIPENIASSQVGVDEPLSNKFDLELQTSKLTHHFTTIPTYHS